MPDDTNTDPERNESTPITLGQTRRSLHVVAELVLAGPQSRTSGTVRLSAAAGGFRTIAEPDIRVEGGEVVRGATRIAINASTPAALSSALGVNAVAPDTYHDGTGATAEEELVVSAVHAEALAEWFQAGQEALLALAPTEVPVLWPEHFDNAITADEINYGVSPGDSFSEVPYAYVGPWTPREGDFWNAPFGAFRTWTDLGGAAALLDFFRQGRRLAQGR